MTVRTVKKDGKEHCNPEKYARCERYMQAPRFGWSYPRFDPKSPRDQHGAYALPRKVNPIIDDLFDEDASEPLSEPADDLPESSYHSSQTEDSGPHARKKRKYAGRGEEDVHPDENDANKALFAEDDEAAGAPPSRRRRAPRPASQTVRTIHI